MFLLCSYYILIIFLFYSYYILNILLSYSYYTLIIFLLYSGMGHVEAQCPQEANRRGTLRDPGDENKVSFEIENDLGVFQIP